MHGETWFTPQICLAKAVRLADKGVVIIRGGNSDMAISLTAAAADRVRGYLQSQGKGVGLRVGVKKTGCSGFAYVVNYAEEIGPADTVFDDQGVKVVVDADSLALIDGTVVDFVKQGLNEAFKFKNPNVKAECGCGESFSV
jgi:iron-sulfur cluster assembly protein